MKFLGSLLAIGGGLALVGAAVGLLAWFVRELVGGGDALTQRALTVTDPLGVLAGVFVLDLHADWANNPNQKLN